MRKVDHKDMRKHFAAISRINPCCTAKLVHGRGDVARDVGFDDFGDHQLQTMRLLIEHGGKRIRAGMAIGGIIDGKACLSATGMLCLSQWMRAYPEQEVIFAEFKQVATGNIERLRARLLGMLDNMTTISDGAVLMLVAKNSVMYDKLGALIQINAKPSPAS